jgi:Sulfotransferase family
MRHNNNNYKYVFVCGLQRSGTSLLGRNVARLENCTGLTNTGVFMDEGQFIQDVYPIDNDLGGAGRFGFDPRAHRTETSELLTPENIERLKASWHRYWDSSKTFCVEKTPANLLMTRFLQVAFPDSYFIIMKRHPVPVSMASQRWKLGVTPLYRLIEHWLHCHHLFEQDRKHLRRVYELSYEDYVADPAKYHQEIAEFIGTRVPEPSKEDTFRIVAEWRNPTGVQVPERKMEGTSSAHNRKYLDRWSNLASDSLFRHYYRYVANKYERSVARYGYSLIKNVGVSEEVFRRGKEISVILGPVYCRWADAWTFFQRFGTWFRWYLKQQIKAVLPQFVLTKIRMARQRAALTKSGVNAVSS